MRITICGGGNIAHSLAATLASSDKVSILTRRPLCYSKSLASERNGILISGGPIVATDDTSIISSTELIIVALPRFAVADELDRICCYLHAGQTIVFIPAPCGLEETSRRLQERYGVDTIAFQRVPYVARIIEYGKSVRISQDRRIHRLVISDSLKKEYWGAFFSSRFGGTVEWLSSFLTLTFSNSNPLLHPARLMVLLKNLRYEKMPLFYDEWTDESSDLYIAADSEMYNIICKFNEEDLLSDYESGLKHYESTSASELTKKIKSISALKGITAPYKLDATGGYVADYSSRYFTEDVPFGTVHIQEYARKMGVTTPTIDYFVSRIMGVLHE